MTVYEASKKLKQIENELIFLKEQRALAFESTQPKAMKVNEVSVQSSHKIETYTKLDYSIDEIEPRINFLEKEAAPLKKYINNYYEILKEYDPKMRQIIKLREEYGMTWEKVSELCHYSEIHCKRKYYEYKRGENK